jgi:hypothetical protein
LAFFCDGVRSGGRVEVTMEGATFDVVVRILIFDLEDDAEGGGEALEDDDEPCRV